MLTKFFNWLTEGERSALLWRVRSQQQVCLTPDPGWVITLSTTPPEAMAMYS